MGLTLLSQVDELYVAKSSGLSFGDLTMATQNRLLRFLSWCSQPQGVNVFPVIYSSRSCLFCNHSYS